MSDSSSDQRRAAIREEILALFRNHGQRTFRPKEVANKLGYRDNEDYRLCRSLLEELEENGQIRRIKGNQFGLRQGGSLMVGRLMVHPRGYGFVRVEGISEDFFVRARRLNTGLDGDEVSIALAARKPGDERREAEVLEVLKRGRSTAVGTFEHSGSFAVVVPDDRRLTHDIYVDLDTIGDAQNGDKVQVSIDSFEHRGGAPRGRILKVIGSADDPEIQTIALAMSIGVDVDFPREVLDEAERIQDVISEDEIRKREDFRQETVFTIDPADAKDFDDALHLKPLSNGNLEVGIHIADVSHYVAPGTELDRVARERGTSVYLVDRVIPMLPEHLSNQICSLNPGVDRLTFSCVVELTPAGKTVNFRVVNGIICSAHRLSYEQAQEVILGLKPDHALKDTLPELNRMAKSMRDVRFEHGSIDFDLREVRVELDDTGRPVRIVPRERRDAHRLIEEYMLLANRLVAQRYGDEAPAFVFRIHDPPDADRISQLANYIGAFGHELPHENGAVTPKALNALLRSVSGRPEAPVIEEAALRSMSRARYDTDNHGHYGLAAEFYTHFTSPIRRYPDLLVHRLVREKMDGQRRVDPEGLSTLAKHCSEREQVATEAERESVQLKKVEYVLDHIGEEHHGVISGVSRFGVYIELSELLVEGMVHVRTMDGDYYEYDEDSFSLVGRRSGKRYRPGDEVRVLIAGASMESREIDFEFV
ncbi:MAG: ribonuclease R [Bacteroidota bacterium]|nr:ribonuclease R [Bacteroidota bacterium]